MRVSISVQSAYNVDDSREGARRMIDRARVAGNAGLDALFVGDHHATALPYYQNTAILGRMLAEWGERPAGALYLLPLWHPLIVAEQVGTLASVMTGRFILQCAIGPADNQFEAMGVPVRQRPSRFEQSLSILRRLWSGETVTTGGENDRFGLREARVSPLPPEPVEVWIGASAPPAIDRAARLGDGWLAAPGLTPGEAGEQLALYREACERHGRPVGVCAIRRDIYVGETAAEAEAAAGGVISRGYRGFPREALAVGDAARVAASFAELGEMGYDEVVVRHLVQDPARVLQSIGRLAVVRERMR
ncbi:MAG: LLM class flavin-dependent oxidoreductase [Acidobacteriota bacterium]|nr:LLM class flavin-dependent oxidoreductase [Acidobacteriota bacterium]